MTEEELAEHARHEKPSIEDVEAYAAKEKLSFPDDYRDFLVRFNGVTFPGPPFIYSTCDGQGSLMQQLAKYDEVYSYAHPVVGEDEIFVYRFDHCVIGTDLSGDEIILISEAGEYAGAVFHWNHESEAILLEFPEDEIREQLDELNTAKEQIELLTEVGAWEPTGKSFSAFVESIKRG